MEQEQTHGRTVDPRLTIDPKGSRDAIAHLEGALKSATDRREEASARRKASEEEEQLLSVRISSLQEQIRFWEDELAGAPSEPPTKPLRDAVIELRKRNPEWSRDQIHEVLDPAYFANDREGIAKQRISMIMTHADKRDQKHSQMGLLGEGEDEESE